MGSATSELCSVVNQHLRCCLRLGVVRLEMSPLHCHPGMLEAKATGVDSSGRIEHFTDLVVPSKVRSPLDLDVYMQTD